MQNETLKLERGTKVQLNIPASRPIKVLSGNLFESGDTFKVLGWHASLVRLSRIGDNAKLMVLPETLIAA
jgi:hypothetical protein